jgi:GNAT superfamily N-acetyltransferase
MLILPMSFAAILDRPEAKGLLAEYAAECSLPELGEIAPQYYLYEAMERSGTLRSFGVFNDDRLVGFATLLLYVLPHYGKKVATTESIFISAAQRVTGIGSKLLDFIENYARENDCTAVLYSAPTGSQFAKLLGLQKTYRHSNDTFIRSLA